MTFNLYTVPEEERVPWLWSFLGHSIITTLWANTATSADDKMVLFFSCFPQNTGFDISSKLSPMEICMTCQILFSGENKKNISNCRLLKILPRVLSVNVKRLLDK